MSELKFPLTKTIYYITESGGDGSANVNFYESEELAEIMLDSQTEPFGDSEVSSFTFTVDDQGNVSFHPYTVDSLEDCLSRISEGLWEKATTEEFNAYKKILNLLGIKALWQLNGLCPKEQTTLSGISYKGKPILRQLFKEEI